MSNHHRRTVSEGSSAARSILSSVWKRREQTGRGHHPGHGKEKPQEGRSSPSATAAVTTTARSAARVKAGDKILFGKLSGSEVKIADKNSSSCARKTSSPFSSKGIVIHAEAAQVRREPGARVKGRHIMAAAVKATLGPRAATSSSTRSSAAPRSPRTASPSQGDRAEGKVREHGAAMVRESPRRPPTSP